jgi:hypothetical protein
MSDKKLLNENTVRRFMKLASNSALTDNFIQEMGYGKYKRDEEDIQENDEDVTEAAHAEEEDVSEAAHEDDEPMSEQEEEMELDMDADMDADMDMDMDAGDADISLTEEEAQVLIDLGERLKEAMAAEDDMDEPEMDMDMDEPEMDEPEMDEPEMDDEDDEAVMENRDAVVQEILRRVTQRIIREKMNNK